MTRRYGRLKRKGPRSAASGLVTHTVGNGGVQPAPGTDDCIPPRTQEEKQSSMTRAAQFYSLHHRYPNSDELNTLVNQVYKAVYPYAPYPIPTSWHSCAKRWLTIRSAIVGRLKYLVSSSGSGTMPAPGVPKPKPKPKPKRVRRRKRTKRRGRRFSGICDKGQVFDPIKGKCIADIFAPAPTPKPKPASGSGRRGRRVGRRRRGRRFSGPG
jgi:hypothetical protein